MHVGHESEGGKNMGVKHNGDVPPLSSNLYEYTMEVKAFVLGDLPLCRPNLVVLRIHPGVKDNKCISPQRKPGIHLCSLSPHRKGPETVEE